MRLLPLLLILASCAKHTPTTEPAWQGSLAGALLVASSIARTVATEADTGDGAVGCIVGEVLGSVFSAAGYQIAALPRVPESTATLDLCACLEMRDDWTSVDITAGVAEYAEQAISGVSLLIAPHVRTCEGQAWLQSATGAVATLAGPVSEAIALQACEVPIPALAPNLSRCSDE